MNKRRRSIEVFNLSFLDVISCGFGAIILLLVISKVYEPTVIEQANTDLRGQKVKLEEELHQIRGDTRVLNQQLLTKEEQLSRAQENLKFLSSGLSDIKGQYLRAQTASEAQSIIIEELESAKQKLTDEMSRLEIPRPQSDDAIIGGIPVDSEYIIFIIDTSGSMQRFAWPLVRKKMREILDIYPRVKGIQVLNDMGDYMFSQYAGRWIPDSKARRRSILNRLSTWAPFSNSSPVEGITSAIHRFYDKNKRISLYVFGDDFSGGLMQGVIDTVKKKNQRGGKDSRVRIHTVGFPVLLSLQGTEQNAARFAALMRRLAEDNNGSFVGLSELQ